MAAFGWNKHHPALVDERGAVITGHRRLEVAKELGLDPLVKVVKYGDDAGPRPHGSRTPSCRTSVSSR